jgi:hypothetical protein
MMLSTRILSLLLGCAAIASAPAAAAADAVPEAEFCAAAVCQRDVRVTLRRKDGSMYDKVFKVFPATVQPAFFSVLAGQTVLIEGDIVDGRLVNMVAVDRVRDPARTLTASFKQGPQGMMLKVTNPFDQDLRFNMGIMPLDGEDVFKTSSCPVRAGMALFESWPQPLFQVLLSNGRVPQPGREMGCVD